MLVTRVWPEATPYAEGQVHETLAVTLPSHKFSKRSKGVYHETSPHGREYNVEVSHDFGKPRGYLRLDQEILDYHRLEGYFTLLAQDMVGTLIQSYVHQVHTTSSFHQREGLP